MSSKPSFLKKITVVAAAGVFAVAGVIGGMKYFEPAKLHVVKFPGKATIVAQDKECKVEKIVQLGKALGANLREAGIRGGFVVFDKSHPMTEIAGKTVEMCWTYEDDSKETIFIQDELGFSGTVPIVKPTAGKVKI